MHLTISQFIPQYLQYARLRLAPTTLREYSRYARTICGCPLYGADCTSLVEVRCNGCSLELPDSLPPEECPNCGSCDIDSACRRCEFPFEVGAVPERCPGCDSDLLLGAVPVCSVNPEHVFMLQERIGEEEDHPTACNRAKVVLSQLCEHAERMQLRAPNTNPTFCVPNYSESMRTEYVAPEDRPRLVASIFHHVAQDTVTRSAGALMLLMFLAGLRWSDASLLRWDEVITHRGVTFLKLHPRGPKRRKSKGGGARIPLPPTLQQLVMLLPREAEWVAPNPDTGLPYTEIRGQRDLIYETAGVRLRGYHGLRHSTGAACVEAGLTLEQTAAQLGQRSVKAAQRYGHFAGSAANNAASLVEARILGMEVRCGVESSGDGEAAAGGGGRAGDPDVRGPQLAGGARVTALAVGVFRRGGHVHQAAPRV